MRRFPRRLLLATAADPCAGTITLATAHKVLVAKKKARKRALRLASGKVNLKPGQAGTVRLRLSKTGRRVLATTRKLSAKLTFVLTDRTGAKTVTVKRVTLHAPKVRKKHKHR